MLPNKGCFYNLYSNLYDNFKFINVSLSNKPEAVVVAATQISVQDDMEKKLLTAYEKDFISLI